jgi:hypothetical protein
MRRSSFLAVSLLLSCGERSPLFVDQAAAPADAAVDVSRPGRPAPVDAGEADAGSSATVDARADAEAEAEAGPAKPCHLVASGDAVQSVTFSQQGYAFRQEGLFLRSASSGPPHVVQYGAVAGAGTDGWGDPALYAAEYDVSVWPPREVHVPTRFSDADENGSYLVELPGNQLFFAWGLQVDNGGIGPPDILFQTADATSWQLGAQGTLVKHATAASPPTLAAKNDGLLLAYTQVLVDSIGYATSLSGAVASFAFDGSARSDAAATWALTSGFIPQQDLARTTNGVLTVVAFDDCAAGLSSVYCEPHSIVVLRVVEPTESSALVLQKVASVPVQNADNAVETPGLFSDQNGHDWLTWWEAPRTDAGAAPPQNLYAVPLTSAGAPSGPVESWFASDHLGWATFGVWPPSVTVGPLGTIYPVATYLSDDAGALRHVHLVHRQLDVTAPVEDITFVTAETTYTVVAVQIADPRSVIVGYSTYPPGANGCGELARYTCAEDAD